MQLGEQRRPRKRKPVDDVDEERLRKKPCTDLVSQPTEARVDKPIFDLDRPIRVLFATHDDGVLHTIFAVYRLHNVQWYSKKKRGYSERTIHDCSVMIKPRDRSVFVQAKGLALLFGIGASAVTAEIQSAKIPTADIIKALNIGKLDQPVGAKYARTREAMASELSAGTWLPAKCVFVSAAGARLISRHRNTGHGKRVHASLALNGDEQLEALLNAVAVAADFNADGTGDDDGVVRSTVLVSEDDVSQQRILGERAPRASTKGMTKVTEVAAAETVDMKRPEGKRRIVSPAKTTAPRDEKKQETVHAAKKRMRDGHGCYVSDVARRRKGKAPRQRGMPVTETIKMATKAEIKVAEAVHEVKVTENKPDNHEVPTAATDAAAATSAVAAAAVVPAETVLFAEQTAEDDELLRFLETLDNDDGGVGQHISMDIVEEVADGNGDDEGDDDGEDDDSDVDMWHDNYVWSDVDSASTEELQEVDAWLMG